MERPEAYRKNAEQCLREAEEAPQSVRLELIKIAQHWLELADHAERLRGQSPEAYEAKKDPAREPGFM